MHLTGTLWWSKVCHIFYSFYSKITLGKSAIIGRISMDLWAYFRVLATPLTCLFYASVPATAVAGGFMFLGCPMWYHPDCFNLSKVKINLKRVCFLDALSYNKSSVVQPPCWLGTQTFNSIMNKVRPVLLVCFFKLSCSWNISDKYCDCDSWKEIISSCLVPFVCLFTPFS